MLTCLEVTQAITYSVELITSYLYEIFMSRLAKLYVSRRGSGSEDGYVLSFNPSATSCSALLCHTIY